MAETLLIDCPPATLVERFRDGVWSYVVTTERHIEYGYFRDGKYHWTFAGNRYRSSPSHAVGVWHDRGEGRHTLVRTVEDVKCRR